jgi:hypothetical protein
MKKVPEENTGKYVLEELLTALAIVVELAEGNCLDTHDPDMADECDRQLGAVDLVKQFVADNTPELLGPTAGIIPPMNRCLQQKIEHYIDAIRSLINASLVLNGDTGEDCQRILIEIKLQALEHSVNGISSEDMKPN